MVAARACWLIAALWVGSLWTVGYLVAPTLFATLTDRSLAGSIAGRLFRAEAWLSVACALVLMALLLTSLLKGKGAGSKAEPDSRGDQPQARSCLVLVTAMLACTLAGYFGLQPFMAALRESGLDSAEVRSRFGMLHGISSAIYLVESGLGIALLLKIR